MALLVTYSAYWAKSILLLLLWSKLHPKTKKQPLYIGRKTREQSHSGGPFHTHLVVSMSMVTAVVTRHLELCVQSTMPSTC